MNLHVLFVHFPVAFLTIYSILELVRFKKITSQPYWFYVKAAMVIVGALSLVPTVLAGEAIAEKIGSNADPSILRLVEQHETFAAITATIFGIIAVVYFIAWVNKALSLRGVQPTKQSFIDVVVQSRVWTFLTKLSSFIIDTPVVVMLALLGLVSVTFTGGIGGIMAFGDKADPFFAFFYHLFIK